MQNPLAKTIEEILEIINYQQDRQKFAEEFADSCAQLALIEALEGKPEEFKTVVNDQLSQAKTPEDVAGVIKENFDQEEFTKILFKISFEQIENFVNKIGPSLSQETRNNLADYFSTAISQLQSFQK